MLFWSTYLSDGQYILFVILSLYNIFADIDLYKASNYHQALLIMII